MGTTWIAPRMGRRRHRCMLSPPMTCQAFAGDCHTLLPCCTHLLRAGDCLLHPPSWAGSPSHSSLLPFRNLVAQWPRLGAGRSWTGRYTKRSLTGSACSPCSIPRTKDMTTVCVSASTSFSLGSSCLLGAAFAALAFLRLCLLLKAQRPETNANRPYCQKRGFA